MIDPVGLVVTVVMVLFVGAAICDHIVRACPSRPGRWPRHCDCRTEYRTGETPHGYGPQPYRYVVWVCCWCKRVTEYPSGYMPEPTHDGALDG